MSDPIDYESLLRRYMKIVIEKEGTGFVLSARMDGGFSTGEIAHLKNLEDELV